MNDFGKRLEAALNRQTTSVLHGADTWVSLLAAVRAANAQDSAPALERTDFSSPSNEGGVASGAGVDLADAMRSLQFCIQTPGLNISAMLNAAQCRALLSHIESLERDAARYRWLMDEGSGNSPLARANRIYARWNGEDGAEGFSRVVDAARKEGKP